MFQVMAAKAWLCIIKKISGIHEFYVTNSNINKEYLKYFSCIIILQKGILK